MSNQLIRNSTAEFLIFTGQSSEQSIEARYEDESIWLTQKLMAELFGVDVRTINEHLRNIFKSNELDERSVIRKFRTTAADGKTTTPNTTASTPSSLSATASTHYEPPSSANGPLGCCMNLRSRAM